MSGARVGIVADLWRFPVKSFGGERTRRTFVGPFGPIGDRRYAVTTPGGEPLSARRLIALLRYSAHYRDRDHIDAPSVTTPDGRVYDVDDPDLSSEIGALMDRDVELTRTPQAFHDAAPVHIVGLQAVAAIGALLGNDLDVRRFRPNIVAELSDDVPFAEAGWVGKRIRVGESVELQVVSPTERCVVTTVDPDTGERDKRVLAKLASERENLFGVYALVRRPGWVSVGDEIIATDG